MKTDQILKELEDVARQLGVDVRVERGGFRGGLCTIDDEQVIMLNKRQPAETRLSVLADSLRSLPVDTVFMRPVVRDALESSWKGQAEVELDGADFDE
ncbi:MAG: hypothetical protein R3178_06650 [Rhodothermales bacterium]|nr:hypothetical protein [Rhodothermales bacterium]